MLRIGCWSIWSAAETRILDGVIYEVTPATCPIQLFIDLWTLSNSTLLCRLCKTWKQTFMLIRTVVPPSLCNQITFHTVKYINFHLFGIYGKFHQVDRSSFFLWPLYFPYFCVVIPREIISDRWSDLTNVSHWLSQCCQ